MARSATTEEKHRRYFNRIYEYDQSGPATKNVIGNNALKNTAL
ncbi:hypothetical protein AB1278_00370 [Chryseobacterium sp. NRRL B-14798]